MINNKILSPKQVLNNAMEELEYTPKDILHIAAIYMNQNIKRICKWNGELLDLSKYAAPNFNQKDWDEQVKKMKENFGLEKKLEFQTALFAITSEPLMRDYFYNMNRGEGNAKLAEKMNNPERFTHAKLAVSYADQFESYIYLPSFNGNGIRISNSKKLGDYINDLRDQAENGVNPQVIIEDLLENFSEYFFLEKEDKY